jgi:phosphonate transport system substrate-binding protein
MRMKKSALLLALTIATIPLALNAAESYKISIMPRFFNEKLTTMMTPLVDYLRRETGLDIELVLATDNADYIKRLNRGEIAIGFENPIVYVDVTPRHQVIAAAEELGEARFRGIVVVPTGSDIKELKDLRGKHVMITGKTSAGGYLSQKLSLAEAGIAMNELITETAADNRQENVVIAVSIGDVDAGFIRESALHSADQYIAPKSVKRVIDTEWMPPWAFSVDTELPQTVRTKFKEAVLKLQPGDPVLKALEIDRFIPGQDQDYDRIRRALGENR